MNAIIVEDNAAFRKTFKNVLQTEFDINVISEFSNGKEFLEHDLSNCNIVFMDLEMPEMNGFIAAKKATWEYKLTKFIAVTSHKESEYMIKVVEAGFNGFINKHTLFSELPDAIKTVMSGQLYFSSLDNNL